MKSSMSPGQVRITVSNYLIIHVYVVWLFYKGDIFADPTLLIPNVADKKNLAKVYDVVSTN